VGRFLSVDPIAKEYPELTPYQFASNSPIAHIDLDGLEKVIYLINMQTNTTTKLELPKAGRLGNGVAAQVVKKNGEIHGFYGTDAVSALGFIKQYEKNGVDGHPFERYDDKYGNATIGYGHKLESDGKKLYPVGAKITPDQADKLLNTDYKSKSDLVARNLKASGLNKNQLEALIDFAFNVRKADSRVASFTTATGSTYFLEFMKGGPDLESRRVGESLMYDFGKYFKFDGLTKRQTDYLNKLVTDITSPSPPPSTPKASSTDKPKSQ
jgi:hypothetical protein